MSHIDLFTGLAGFTLACHWAGIQTEVMCENDKRCRQFLERTWPGIPIIPDVRDFDGTKWRGRFLLTAGVPCQPASRAGKQRGKDDDRWLWGETLRVVSEARPDWVLFENPPGINDVGLDGILADLEALDYEVAPPLIIPACAVGSPQLRKRYWIVAYNKSIGRSSSWIEQQNRIEENKRGESANNAYSQSHMADTEKMRKRSHTRGSQKDCGGTTADPWGYRSINDENGRNIWSNSIWLPCADRKIRRSPFGVVSLANGIPVELLEELGTEGRQTEEDCRVTRQLLAALGNSIVPQVAYEIIKAIREADENHQPKQTRPAD